MFVQPQFGYQIPDLDLGDTLPQEGREVVDSDFWQRRLRDGDVVIGQAPQQTNDMKAE